MLHIGPSLCVPYALSALCAPRELKALIDKVLLENYSEQILQVKLVHRNISQKGCRDLTVSKVPISTNICHNGSKSALEKGHCHLPILWGTGEIMACPVPPSCGNGMEDSQDLCAVVLHICSSSFCHSLTSHKEQVQAR